MAIAGLILGAISLVLAIAALAGSSIGYGETLIFIIVGLNQSQGEMRRSVG